MKEPTEIQSTPDDAYLMVNHLNTLVLRVCLQNYAQSLPCHIEALYFCRLRNTQTSVLCNYSLQLVAKQKVMQSSALE